MIFNFILSQKKKTNWATSYVWLNFFDSFPISIQSGFSSLAINVTGNMNFHHFPLESTPWSDKTFIVKII